MPRPGTSRRWIKVYPVECLEGSIRWQLEPDERGTWYDLLNFAALCRQPGLIADADGRPFPRPFIANRLNISLELLERTLKKCEEEGRIFENENGIHIVNWERYQSEYERQKKYRKSTAESTKKLNVEKSVENVSSITEQNRSDQRNNITTTTRDREFKELVNFYESNIGLISPFVAEKFKEAYDYYPADYIRHAIEEAALRDRGRRSWAYVEAILKRLENDYGNPKQRREHGEIK